MNMFVSTLNTALDSNALDPDTILHSRTISLPPERIFPDILFILLGFEAARLISFCRNLVLRLGTAVIPKLNLLSLPVLLTCLKHGDIYRRPL